MPAGWAETVGAPRDAASRALAEVSGAGSKQTRARVAGGPAEPTWGYGSVHPPGSGELLASRRALMAAPAPEHPCSFFFSFLH